MATKAKRTKRLGRPPLATQEIRWSVRLDEDTDAAIHGLAEHWSLSRSEALRKAVKERAVKEGVLKQHTATKAKP